LGATGLIVGIGVSVAFFAGVVILAARWIFRNAYREK
jgi:hypothetical protein